MALDPAPVLAEARWGQVEGRGYRCSRLGSAQEEAVTPDRPSTGYGPSTYGDAFADVYDAWYGDGPDVALAVALVAGLARNGAALRARSPDAPRLLELGVGTGRLALPLAAEGLDVMGLDASTAMLARLAANDHDGLVVPVLGHMAGPLPDGPFDTVLCAFNGLLNLTSAADQAACLHAVRHVLGPGGVLVVEAFVPDLEGGSDRHVEVRRIGDSVLLDVSIREPQGQVVRGQQVELGPAGVRLRPWRIRYLGTDELDRLATGAGLRLAHRWSDWERSPFDPGAARHVSVFEAAAGV